jgi:hypothetical protein
MPSSSRKLEMIATLAAFMLPVTAAQAQYYGGSTQPAPLYPYAIQGDQPYAVEVAPNTYMIKRAAPTQSEPYVRSRNGGRGIINQAVAPAPGKFDRPHKPVDHALVEELRQRKSEAAATQQIVRDPPVVAEHQRVVNDSPRVITRRHMAEDQPDGSHAVGEENAPSEPSARPSAGDTKRRVIQADAEVTILGPDRMSIRLFRKGQGPKANARAD